MVKSLKHKLVVVTRSAAGNRAWASYLQALDAQVYSLPTIETAPLPLTADTAAILKRLADFDWLILTSANSIRYLRESTQRVGVQMQPKGLQIAVIGEQTAHAAKQAGLCIAFQPSRANSKTLGAELTPVRGKRILLPQTTIAPNDLAEALRIRGGTVTSLPLYRTNILDTPDEKLLKLLSDGKVDVLTFASPSAVHGFTERLTRSCLQRAHELPAIAVGPEVAARLAESGFLHIYTSATPSIGGILNILQQLAS